MTDTVATTTTTAADTTKAEGTTTTTTTDDKTKAGDDTKGTDVADVVAKLTAQVEALTNAKAASDKAADDQRRASLTEADRLAEDRKVLDAEKLTVRTGRRTAALDKLGVAEKFRTFAPDVDPADPAGAAALETWAKANPELLSRKEGAAPDPMATMVAGAKGKLAEILAGKASHPLITPGSLSKMFRP